MLQNGVMMESLEGRRFLSGTVLPVGSGVVASPAAIVKAAILGPSLVEGTYKGTATDTNGAKLAMKLVVTSTRETLTIEGYGTKAVTLTSSKFKALREGSFSYDGKIDGYTVKLSGSVTDSGSRISGAGTITGSGSVSGTFVLKK